MKVIFQNSHDKNIITKICKLNNQKSELIDGSGVDLNLFKPEIRSYYSLEKIWESGVEDEKINFA